MTGLPGIRVMRGPHWDQGDIDGGEGHLGTVTKALDNGQVQVLWDKGQESACHAGVDGKFDLRVFDSAQADTKCAECEKNNIYGTLWRCKDCSFGDLCPLCYGDDKHDTRHCFLRFDHYKSDGVLMKKRKVSTRMRSMGTFPGAKVVQGRDWMWGDQDGGVGSQGEALAFENVAPNSSRNLLRVKWLNGKSNSYRLGHNGHVDLKCVEEEVGPYYYRDHLPLLDASKLPYPLAPQAAFGSQPSTTSSAQTSPATGSSSSDTTTPATTTTTPQANSHTPPPPIPPKDKPRGTPPIPPRDRPQGSDLFPSQAGAVGGIGTGSREVTEQQEEEVAMLVVGDEVMVGVNENTLRDLQEDYGGVSQRMIQRLGEKGVVTEVNTGVIVRFGSASYRLNPMVLVKVWPLKEGDVVRIRRDVSQVKLLNKHIAWNQQIADTCGSVGRVQAIHKDNSITATFGHYQTFRFATPCCVPAPTATPDPVGTLGQARKAAVANTDAAEPSPGDGLAGGPMQGGGDPSTLERMLTEMSASVFEIKDNRDGTGDGQGLGDDSDAGMRNEILRRMGLLQDSGDSDDNCSDPQLKILFPMISQGNTSAVKTMVQANPSLLTKTNQSLTPLMYACYKGQQDVVTSLLELGADINSVGKNGRTPLYIAISREHENVAIMLLQRGANLNVKNHRQRTPLHAAAYDNLTRVARMLICMGADVNAKDMVQDTPLFDAIDKGHAEVAEVLLEAPGLNSQALNIKGFNMLQLACLQGKGRIVELILSSKNCPGVDELLTGEYSALHIAANNDHVECVGILVLLGGATVDIRDGRRRLTPLHLACKRRQAKAAEALMGLGAAVNARDVNNNTPLHLAMGKSLEGDNDDKDVSPSTAVEQRTSLACVLLTHGADADMRDDRGKSPLAYGYREVQVNVEQYLINMGICAPEDQGATAMAQPPAAAAASGGDTTGLASKQDDMGHLNHLLQGVSIRCASCHAMSDVTLEPCGHKVVCRKCCDAVTQCPQCGKEVEDREPDNTDEQEEEEEGEGTAKTRRKNKNMMR